MHNICSVPTARTAVHTWFFFVDRTTHREPQMECYGGDAYWVATEEVCASIFALQLHAFFLNMFQRGEQTVEQ